MVVFPSSPKYPPFLSVALEPGTVCGIRKALGKCWIYGWRDGEMERCREGGVEGWKGGQTEGWRDRRKDRGMEEGGGMDAERIDGSERQRVENGG